MHFRGPPKIWPFSPIYKGIDHLTQGLEPAIREVLTAVLHLIVKETFFLGLEGLICHDLCEMFSWAVLGMVAVEKYLPFLVWSHEISPLSTFNNKVSSTSGGGKNSRRYLR